MKKEYWYQALWYHRGKPDQAITAVCRTKAQCEQEAEYWVKSFPVRAWRIVRLHVAPVDPDVWFLEKDGFLWVSCPRFPKFGKAGWIYRLELGDAIVVGTRGRIGILNPRNQGWRYVDGGMEGRCKLI